MRKSEGSAMPGDLVVVQRQFEHWRATRSKLCRIPEGLWSGAIEVAGEHGVQRVARALRLDYMDLKRRVQSSHEQQSPVSVAAVRFVEFALSELPPRQEARGSEEGRAGTEPLLEPVGAPGEPVVETDSASETASAGPSFLLDAGNSGPSRGSMVPAAQSSVPCPLLASVGPVSAPHSVSSRDRGDEWGGGPEVELLSPDGTRLVVRLPVGERLDVVALCTSLWRRGA